MANGSRNLAKSPRRIMTQVPEKSHPLKQDDWEEGLELWMASKCTESTSSVTDEAKLIKWVKQQQDDYVKWRKGEPTFLEDEGFQLLDTMGFYWGDGVHFDPAKKEKALLKPSAAPLTNSQKFHSTLKPPVVIQSVTPKIRQTETRQEIPLQKPIVVMNSLPPTDEKEKKADDTLGFETFRGSRCSVEGTSTLPTEEKQNSEKETPSPIQISDTSTVKGSSCAFVSASLFKEPSRFSNSITMLKEAPSKTPPTVNESTAQIAPTPTLEDYVNNIVATLPLENRAKVVPALPSKEKGSEPKIIVVSDSPFKESAIRIGMDLTVEEPTKRVAFTPPLKELPSEIPFVKEPARSIISNLPFKKRRTDFVVTQPGTNAAGSTSTAATVSLIAPTKMNSNSLSREPTSFITSTLPWNRQTSTTASHQSLKEYAHNVVNLPLNKPTPANAAPSQFTEPDISFVSALPLKEPTTKCTSTPSSEEPSTLQGGNKRRGRRKVDDALAGNDEDQKLSLSPFFQSNQLKASKRMTFSVDDTISNIVAGDRRIPLMSLNLPGSKLLGEIPLHSRLREEEKSDAPRKVESKAFIGPESYASQPGFPTEIDNPETIEARPEIKLSDKLSSLVEGSVNSTAILEKATPTSPPLRNHTFLTKIDQIHIKLNPARSDREMKKVVQTAIQTGKPSSFSGTSRDTQKKTSLKLCQSSGFPERVTVGFCVPELKSDEEQSTAENRDIPSQKGLNLVQAEATSTSKFDTKMSETLHVNQPQIQNNGLKRMRDFSSIVNRTSTPSFGGAHNAELTADISKTEQGDALVPISCEAIEESNACAYTEVMQHNASVVVALDCIGQHDDSGCARLAQSMAPKGEREKPKNNPGRWKTLNGMAQKSKIMGKEGRLPLSLQWERVKAQTRIASEYLSSDVDDEEEKSPPADKTGPPQLCEPQTMPESCKLAKPKRPFETARWKHKKGQHSLIASSSDLSDSCRSGTSKASETRISSQTIGDKSWEQFYQELTAFIAAGSNIALEVNRLLRDWALQQFDEYENHMYGRPTNLSLDQFALLQQIDFEGSSVVRDADSAEWIEYYEMLLKHFEQHGSLSGVQSWSTLGKWVETLRIHFGFYVDGTGGCLTNERVDLLQALDFEFAQPRRRAQPDRFGVGTKQDNVATGGGPSKTPSRDSVNCKKGRSGKRKAHEGDKQHVSGEFRPKRWPAAAKNRIERDKAVSRNHKTWWASRDDIVKRSIRRKTRTADEGHDDIFDDKADELEIMLSEKSCSDDYTSSSDSESSFLESASGCASEGELNSDKVRHAKQQVVTYHYGNAKLLPTVKKWARKDEFDDIDDETYDRLLEMKEPLEPGPGVSKLDAIANRKWQVRFEEFVEFRKRFNHCMVPTEDKSLSALSNWAAKMRLFKKTGGGALTQNRTERLTALGFVWAFDYDGHNAGLQIQKKAKIVELLTKQESQLMRNKPVKSPEDLERLRLMMEPLDVSANVSVERANHNLAWQMMFEKLIEFYKEKCHCDVPREGPYKSLQVWCKRMKKAAHTSTNLYRHDTSGTRLNDNRRFRLHALGLKWYIDILNEDPSDRTVPLFSEEASKTMRAKSVLSDEDLDQLCLMKESLTTSPGVNIKMIEANRAWQANFKKLVESYKKNKGCYMSMLDLGLQEWCHRMRQSRWDWVAGKKTNYMFSKNRYLRLHALGFVWEIEKRSTVFLRDDAVPRPVANPSTVEIPIIWKCWLCHQSRFQSLFEACMHESTCMNA